MQLRMMLYVFLAADVSAAFSDLQGRGDILHAKGPLDWRVKCWLVQADAEDLL